MDCGVGPGSVALLAVEVLDKGGESVELAACRIPAYKNFTGVCAEVEGQHLLLVIHVDLDLLGGLCVGDGIAVADLDFGTVFAARSQEGADDALLVGWPAEGVVEDGEDGLRTHCQLHRLPLVLYVRAATDLGLDRNIQRGGRRLGTDGDGAKWARQMEEGVLFGHGECGFGVRGGAAQCVRPGVVVSKRAMNATSGAVDIIRKILAGAILVKHGPSQIKKSWGSRGFEHVKTSQTQTYNGANIERTWRFTWTRILPGWSWGFPEQRR
jgi:hypothetical protein